MLRLRILTAVVLLPLVYLLVFQTGAALFAVLLALILLLGSWEFGRLATLGPSASWVLVLVQGLLFAALAGMGHAWQTMPGLVLTLGCLAWLPMLLQLRQYQAGEAPGPAYRLRSLVNALTAITFAWLALVWLRTGPDGEWWLVALLLVIWAADIGAYFTGRAIGGAKLAPRISPGKTLSGLAGGLVLAALVAGLLAALPGPWHGPVLPLALLGLITALVSAGGDLFISLHKRRVGCKDTGQIFPGHGGLLDRIDSLLAGAPFFALGIFWMDL